MEERSSGVPRWWTLVVTSCWTLCLVEQLKAPLVGFGTNPPNGVRRFGGRCWICQARTGSPMTGCCPTPIRWPIRSMWCVWPTAVLIWCADGSRTKRWDTEDEGVILSIGSAGC